MKKVLGILLIVLGAIAVVSGCSKAEKESDVFKKQGENDAINFKKAYEDLNTLKDDDGYFTYQTLDIDKENLVVIMNYEDTVKFFESGTGVFYFGRPGCPWCRKMIGTLIDFGFENDEQIYYYDVEKIRSENNKEYKDLLAILDEYLPVDTVTQKEDSKKFNKDLKRIYLPYFFFVKDGKVMAYLNGYEEPNLSRNNLKEFKKILEKDYQLIK